MVPVDKAYISSRRSPRSNSAPGGGGPQTLSTYLLASQVDGGFEVDINLTRLRQPGPLG